MIEIPVSILDSLAVVYDHSGTRIVNDKMVFDEFRTSVVPELKNELVDGATLDDLYIDGGSCRTLWTSAAQERLVADNADREWESYELGLEGQSFSAALLNERVLDVLTAIPVDWLLRSAARQHVIDHYGIDPLSNYDQVTWVAR